MKIEQVIKQEKFDSEFHKAVINVLYTGKWISGQHQSLMKKHGISAEQYNVLRILRGQKGQPIGINEVTARMIDKMSNTSRLVDKLQSKGLVERKVCPQDRRSVDLLITSKGLSILADIDPLLQDISSTMDKLTTEEAATLNFLLDKIRE